MLSTRPAPIVQRSVLNVLDTNVEMLLLLILLLLLLIVLKGAKRDAYNLLTAPRTVSNTYAQMTRTHSCANHVQHQITCNTSSAYHVQHVVCHLVRRDSSAVKFDRVEISFISALSYWLSHPPMKEGTGGGVGGGGGRARRECSGREGENREETP